MADMCEITRQITTMIDKNKPEHQLIGLLAQLIDTKFNHLEKNNKSNFIAVAEEFKEVKASIEEVRFNLESRMDNQDTHMRHQDNTIEQATHNKECPFKMNEKVVELETKLDVNIKDINKVIAILKFMQEHPYVALLSFIGICSLMGLGAERVLKAVSQITIF